MLRLWYRNCGRITSSGDYIRELDSLRFFALATVFYIHLNHAVHGAVESSGKVVSKTAESFTHVIEFGALAVQVFFFISAFILAKPFAEAALLGSRKVSLRAFYLRRLTRLEPPLIIHLTIMLGVYVVFVGKSFVELLPHYLATCTYLHSAIYGVPSPLNPMTWSLEVEVQFYLTTPLLCLLFRIRNMKLRRAVILLGILGFGMIGNSLPRTALPTQLPFFLAGFLLLDLYLLDWNSKPRKCRAFVNDMVGCVCFILFCLVCTYHKHLPMVSGITALLFFGFFWAVFRGNWLRKPLRNHFLETIGGMCYTFYLYHLAVITTVSVVVVRWMGQIGYLQISLFYLVLIGTVNIAVCSVLFVLFERPFMKWRPKPGHFMNGLRSKAGSGK